MATPAEFWVSAQLRSLPTLLGVLKDGAASIHGLVSKFYVSKAKQWELPTSTYGLAAGVLLQRGSLALPVPPDDEILQQC